MEIYSKSESNEFCALAALILQANLLTFSYISNSIKGDILAEILMLKNSCFNLFLRSKLLPTPKIESRTELKKCFEKCT